jgi:hypothetical protein
MFSPAHQRAMGAKWSIGQVNPPEYIAEKAHSTYSYARKIEALMTQAVTLRKFVVKNEC